MPKIRTVSGRNAIKSANSIATAPRFRASCSARNDLLRMLITRAPHSARETQFGGGVPLLAGTGLAAVVQTALGQIAAMAVVVMVTVLIFGPQIAVTRLAKVVFNGCVSTTCTALGCAPFELDVLHERPLVGP